ncbi:MAG TPA: ABC transporter ATP-binding protein, partial [Anaerolineae bacterium]|nr:ABC transporter ATP-binding protein [Anaerolineae bacterium]
VTLIFVVALLGILAPWPLKFIIDNVLRNKPLSGGAGVWVTAVLGTDQRRLTAVLGLALLFITIMQGLAGFAYEYINGLIQERATLNLRSDVFDHVQNLPLQFFDQNRLGDVLKRVNDDSGKIMVALVGSVGDFLVNSVKFIGFALVMLFVNWRRRWILCRRPARRPLSGTAFLRCWPAI